MLFLVYSVNEQYSDWKCHVQMSHIRHLYVFFFKRVANFQRGVNDVLVLLVWNVVLLIIWFPTFRDAKCIDFHWSEVKEKVLVLQLTCTQNSGTCR